MCKVIHKHFGETMASNGFAFWKEVMNNEMDPIVSNNTWILDDFPLSSKPFRFKWASRRKYSIDKSL